MRVYPTTVLRQAIRIMLPTLYFKYLRNTITNLILDKGIPRGFSPSSFPTKILYKFPNSPIRATRAIYLSKTAYDWGVGVASQFADLSYMEQNWCGHRRLSQPPAWQAVRSGTSATLVSCSMHFLIFFEITKNMIRRLLCVGPTFFYSSRSTAWWRGRGSDITWISARRYVGIW